MAITNPNTVENCISVPFISITEPSLKVILLKHINKSNKQKDVISLTSLSVSLIIVLLTADFNDFIVVGATWRGIFIACAVVSMFYTIKAIYINYKNKKDVDETVNAIIDED